MNQSRPKQSNQQCSSDTYICHHEVILLAVRCMRTQEELVDANIAVGRSAWTWQNIT